MGCCVCAAADADSKRTNDRIPKTCLTNPPRCRVPLAIPKPSEESREVRSACTSVQTIDAVNRADNCPREQIWTSPDSQLSQNAHEGRTPQAGPGGLRLGHRDAWNYIRAATRAAMGPSGPR